MKQKADRLQDEIETAREKTKSKFTSHALDDLRSEARKLDEELAQIEAAMSDLRTSLDRDTRHLNEIETLSLKFRRSVSAKAVLSGVAFTSCPRCAQQLPHHEVGTCGVCGQADYVIVPDPSEEVVIDRDVKASEAKDYIRRHQESLASRVRECVQVTTGKLGSSSNVTRRPDGSTRHSSPTLTKERERASLLQEATSLSSLSRLSQMVEQQKESIAQIETKERLLRGELKEAKEAAENDATNLKKLKEFYLDCLIRAGRTRYFGRRCC